MYIFVIFFNKNFFRSLATKWMEMKRAVEIIEQESQKTAQEYMELLEQSRAYAVEYENTFKQIDADSNVVSKKKKAAQDDALKVYKF